MKNLLQNIQSISGYYTKVLNSEDVVDIFEILKTNQEYTQLIGEEASLTSAQNILADLPPDKTLEDKMVIGFYQQDKLVAIVDLVQDYPASQHIFLGLLIVDKRYQGQGKGSFILRGLLSAISKSGFSYCDIGVIDKNERAINFWRKNSFSRTGVAYNHQNYNVIMMSKHI